MSAKRNYLAEDCDELDRRAAMRAIKFTKTELAVIRFILGEYGRGRDAGDKEAILPILIKVIMAMHENSDDRVS